MNLTLHACRERDYFPMMMHTVTVVRQYLTAVFLIVLGLIASGCADSATVNPVVELASLTVTPGTLQPAFSGGTTQYKVDLTSDVTSVRVSAQPAVAGDTVTIDGQATTSRDIPLDPPGETTSVSINVSETSTNSRTYIVLLKRATVTGNNSLASLTVSPGTLTPAFTANTLPYTVNVATNVESISVTPTLSDPNATMTVNGGPAISGQASTVSLNDDPGQSTVIPIAVTAQDGTQKTYSVNVIRAALGGNNNLSALSVSAGTAAQTLSPTFTPSTTAYRVNVGADVAEVTVSATKADPNAVMAIGSLTVPAGTESGEETFPLNGAGGQPTPIFVTVTAQNGVASTTYTITVNRAAPSTDSNLSALTVTPGALAPAFAAGTTAYRVNVGADVAEVTVSATKADPNAVMAIGSLTVPAGTASGEETFPLNGAGTPTPISITVTAQDTTTTQTYTITVNQPAAAPLP
jgi:hypothetical protein